MINAIVPHTGELVDLAHTPTDQIAAKVESVREFEEELRSFKRAANDELAERLDHEGRRSADVGEFHIEVSAPTEKTWDLSALYRTLTELVGDARISQEKADRCVRYEPKPVWAELKTLLSDPRVRDEIARCYSDEPATRSVRIRHA